jgi:hypothetical protein
MSARNCPVCGKEMKRFKNCFVCREHGRFSAFSPRWRNVEDVRCDIFQLQQARRSSPSPLHDAPHWKMEPEDG